VIGIKAKKLEYADLENPEAAQRLTFSIFVGSEHPMPTIPSEIRALKNYSLV